MKYPLTALFATALAAACCAGEIRPCALTVLPVGKVRPEGWLRTQLELQRDGITGQAEELYDDIGNSDWVTGARRGKQYAWERGPYYAKGLVSLAFALDDDALKAKARRWADCILASQRPDGDFGPKARNWWANMISLWLLRDWADATGDARVAPFLARYFDYQRTAFKELPIGKESCWAMARAADELDVVYWLHARTGEAKWLDFAREVSAQTADWTSYYREGGDPSFPHGYRCHIVNFMQGLKAPALQWRLDGDPRKAGAYEAAFAPDGWVMRTCGRPDRMVNGSEPLTDRSATQGTELCAIAERILSCQSVISVLGSAAVADDLEIVAYNALPGTLAPDGKGIRYYCLLNQPACVDKLLLFANNGDRKEMVGAICPGPHAGFGCCRSNFHLAWPKFVQTLWMGTPDGGLAAVAYGPCRVSANGFEIEETGSYPFGGNVTLTVRGDAGHKTLALRIPAWAAGSEVKVNGVAEAGVNPGTFHRVTRDWRAGDVVTLAFPLEVRASYWRHDAVAVSRGPLLYALKMDMKENIVERYKVPYENEWVERGGKLGFPRRELHPASPWGYALVRGADGAFACEASTVSLGENPFRPGCAPVTLRMKAVSTSFGGWGYMREGASARAIDPPPSPVPSAGTPTTTVELVPFGSTQIRISLFPWTQFAR